MCIPLLVGTAATTAGAAAAGGATAMAMGGATTGLLGSAGVFAPLSGSIATGIGSMFSGMGAGSAFNLAGAGISAAGSLYQGAIAEGNYQYQAGMMAYNKSGRNIFFHSYQSLKQTGFFFSQPFPLHELFFVLPYERHLLFFSWL